MLCALESDVAWLMYETAAELHKSIQDLLRGSKNRNAADCSLNPLVNIQPTACGLHIQEARQTTKNRQQCSLTLQHS